jgi:hypothetical protein
LLSIGIPCLDWSTSSSSSSYMGENFFRQPLNRSEYPFSNYRNFSSVARTPSRVSWRRSIVRCVLSIVALFFSMTNAVYARRSACRWFYTARSFSISSTVWSFLASIEASTRARIRFSISLSSSVETLVVSFGASKGSSSFAADSSFAGITSYSTFTFSCGITTSSLLILSIDSVLGSSIYSLLGSSICSIPLGLSIYSALGSSSYSFLGASICSASSCSTIVSDGCFASSWDCSSFNSCSSGAYSLLSVSLYVSVSDDWHASQSLQAQLSQSQQCVGQHGNSRHSSHSII